MKISAIVLFVLMAFTLSAQENIQWRGVDRSGVYKETGLMKAWPENGPSLLWKYEGVGDGYSSVAIAADRIYLTGMREGTGYVYMLDMGGRLLNSKPYGPEWTKNYEGARSTVTVDGDRLFLISGMGEVFCFNRNTLGLVWKKNVLKEFGVENAEYGLAESPLIISEMVIVTVGGKKDNVVALNKDTGSLIWSCPGLGETVGYCSPLYITDQEVPLIVTLTAGHVMGINASDGKMLWSYEQKGNWGIRSNTPLYGDNMILWTVGAGEGSTMVRLTNGGRSIEPVWTLKDMDNQFGGMVKVGDYVYGSGDKNRYWFCADWKTGELKYKERGLAIGNIISADGMLYCYSSQGEMALVEASPEKFAMAGRFRIPFGTAQHWAHPVVYKGVLYVRHGDSLMAYKI